FTERFPADLFRNVAQEKAAMFVVSLVRRERGCRPRAQFQMEAEIADDFLRKQTDQVRKAEEPGVKIGKKLLRKGWPTDIVILLEQEHAQTGTRQIRRRHQAIVTGTENHDIIFWLYTHKRRSLQPLSLTPLLRQGASYKAASDSFNGLPPLGLADSTTL